MLCAVSIPHTRPFHSYIKTYPSSISAAVIKCHPLQKRNKTLRGERFYLTYNSRLQPIIKGSQQELKQQSHHIQKQKLKKNEPISRNSLPFPIIL